MDGIQLYTSAPPRLPSLSQTPPNPAASKAPADYLRAIRRRIWLVLAVAAPLGVASTVWSVRQPAIYQAKAQIRIEPPQYDPLLSTLVSHEVGRQDPDAVTRYLPNKVGELKSKYLAEKVVYDPSFLQGATPPDSDAAEELLKNLQTKILLGTYLVNVSLDGTDAARTAKQLSTLLEKFRELASDEAVKKTEATQTYAKTSLAALENELKGIEKRIVDMLQSVATIGPGGKNIYQSQYESLGMVLMQKRARADELQMQAFTAQLFPRYNSRPEDNDRLGAIRDLQSRRRALELQLQDNLRRVRNPKSDPAVKHVTGRLEVVKHELEDLRRVPEQPATDPSEMIVATLNDEVRAIEDKANALLIQLKQSMPDHQRFVQLQDEREQKVAQIYDLRKRVGTFDMLSQSQKQPVTIQGTIDEPTIPIRPRRTLNVALALVLSLGVGVALVCLLEHLDHSVKVPEHLTIGLTLPLLGVVPRIRRTALVSRGGHLWTPGAPDSVEADAYRNIRASLLGAADRLGPIGTLLITSAKANEGKSTTALNLAATCARAGERTLLMDVDLRRPSLAEVFADEDARELGLVDVLRGELPWQRTVVRTDIPNLDFLPTGDPSDIPIEVLGTLELRQLLIGLSNHYDRVILDGPAILGLADCRLLGRVVDAAVLVVRSGSHEMRPLQRAKAMLEQSRVVLAGVVFNGLYEDFANWSSYGPYLPYGELGTGRSEGRPGVIESTDDSLAALPLAR